MNVRSLITFTDLSRSVFIFCETANTNKRDRDRRHIFIEINKNLFFRLRAHVVISRCFSIISRTAPTSFGYCWLSLGEGKKTEKVIKKFDE